MTNKMIQPNMTIEELATYLTTYVNEQWKEVLSVNKEELEALFPEYEDATYGMYLDKLLPPVWRTLEENGFTTTAKVKEDDFVIAGCLHFSNSLEKAKWGTPEHEKRVFWITLQNEEQQQIGTLLFELSHSHLAFNLPEAPRFIAIQTVDPAEIKRKIQQIEE